MILKDIVSSLEVKPRVALFVSILALIIVLIDRQLYLSKLETLEVELSRANETMKHREEITDKKEATLRRWEIELVQREQEVSRVLNEIKAKSSPRVP